MVSGHPVAHRIRPGKPKECAASRPVSRKLPGPVSGGKTITCEPFYLFEKIPEPRKNPVHWLLHENRPQAIDAGDPHIRFPDPDADREQDIVKQRIDGRGGCAQRIGKGDLDQFRTAE